MNKQLITGIIIGAVMVGLLVGLYLGYQFEKERWINRAYNQAIVDISFNIQQTGNIPLPDNSTGVIQIKSIPIKEICSQGATQ